MLGNLYTDEIKEENYRELIAAQRAFEVAAAVVNDPGSPSKRRGGGNPRQRSEEFVPERFPRNPFTGGAPPNEQPEVEEENPDDSVPHGSLIYQQVFRIGQFRD